MTTPTNVEQLLTVEEVLASLRISRSKLHQLVRSGELRAVKFGRRTLFRAQSVRALIDSKEVKPDKPHVKVRGM